MVTPLRKRTLDGQLYTRDPKIQAQLVELSSLPVDTLLARCEIRCRKDPNYVPSECLLYFLRATRAQVSERAFERLYKLLMERVLRKLPKAENPDGTLSLTNDEIRAAATTRFSELLAEDRNGYSEKLDYFEIRFNGAFAALRHDVRKRVWRDDNRTEDIEADEETGELTREVESAAGSYDPFEASELDAEFYRSRLNAAIEILPLGQRRIVEMIRQGIPIDSKDAGAVTIAKALGKSEKTIRTHRDKAYAALRAALTEGETA